MRRVSRFSGVPKRIIEMLNREINAVMQTLEIRERADRAPGSRGGKWDQRPVKSVRETG